MDTLEKGTILIVDDVKDNIDVLNEILKDSYNIKAAPNGAIALKIAEKFLPDLILLDVMMPGMDGYEVCVKLKDNPVTRAIPVIFVTAKDEDIDEAMGFKVGAVDYLSKPVNPMIVRARVQTHIALSNQRRALYAQVQEKTKALRETQLEIINILGRASDYKDSDTGLHVHRVQEYCYEIGRALGMDEETADLLRNVAPMHDVGKLGIPDHVLKKPGKLDPDEWRTMQAHTLIGDEILGNQESELLRAAKIVAMEHHERVDGKGYPKGLMGDQINLFSKIVAVSDVFDALTSVRPYKAAWATEKAVELIQNERGKQFDEQVVDAFLQVLSRILEIRRAFSD